MTATTCNRCGEPVSPGKRFCAGCGADVSGGQTAVVTATSPSAKPAEPSLIDLLRQATVGEYEVLAEIGRGGMAAVFLAHEIALDRKVAIKVMAPALMTGEGMAERFKREARTAASLSHPHIIPIYAVKESAHLLFFVMKFVEGRSLDSVVEEVGPLSLPLVQTILHQIGDALGYAHRRGIIHRDIKPANVMVDADGHVVVTDFGIAKVLEAKGLTMSGVAVGTPAYMSPEQCSTHDITGASDQYSLGIVTYEMLTGKPPFDDGTFMTLMYAHCNTAPRPLAPSRPDLPAGVAAAVMRMLEKDPSKRFATVQDAVKAVGGTPLGLDDPRREELMLLAKKGTAAELRQRLRTPSSPVPVGRPPTAAVETVVEARRGSAAPRPPYAPPSRASRRWIVPVAVVALVGGVAAVTLLRDRSPSGAVVIAPGSGATPSPSPVAPTAPTPGISTTIPRVEPRPDTTPATRERERARDAAGAIPPAPATDEAFRSLRARARAQRDSAAAAGVSPAQLAVGDAAFGVAEALAATGQVPAALMQLGRAQQAWEQATRGSRRTTMFERSTELTGLPRRGSPPDGVRAELDTLVARYSRALAAGDTTEIRRVFPTITPRHLAALRRIVQRGRDPQVTLRLNEVHPEGGMVRGIITGFVVSTLQNGSSGRTPIVQRARFGRTPAGWTILSIE